MEWGWKVIHLLGVVIFLGNIVISGFWKFRADKTREPVVVAYAQRMVIITDIFFTLVGAGMIAVSGYVFAIQNGLLLHEGWLLWGQVMFYVSALIWLLLLVPLQMKQNKIVQAFKESGEISSEYWKLTKLWNIFGILAVLLPLVALILMVHKPF